MVSFEGRGRRLFSEVEGKNGVAPIALQPSLFPCFFALARDNPKRNL